MAKYDGRFGPQECRDCGANATEQGGSFFKGPKRTHIYRCLDCDTSFRNRNKPKQPETAVETPKELPQPTRVDTFMSGHDNAKHYQASLFDE